jgi:RNA polymerase subunit RPABC4/transcription elongation factor Spt4
MALPPLETIISYLSIIAAVSGALLAALWLSLIIWAFRDMRARSRDPFAQLLAALLVAALPIMGIIIYFILRPPESLAEAYERALEEEALLQEIEEKPRCPGCSRVAEKNWLLCPYCHTRLKKACNDCHNLLELSWNLCPYCGNQEIDPYKVDSPATATAVFETTPVEPDDSVDES